MKSHVGANFGGRLRVGARSHDFIKANDPRYQIAYRFVNGRLTKCYELKPEYDVYVGGGGGEMQFVGTATGVRVKEQS